jgi:hypothetical protein
MFDGTLDLILRAPHLLEDVDSGSYKVLAETETNIVVPGGTTADFYGLIPCIANSENSFLQR